MPAPPFLVDTHCHLDAAEFDRDRDAVRAAALAGGVGAIVIPAIAAFNFDTVARLAQTTTGGAYALGIHPLLTPDATEADLGTLRAAVIAALHDPRFVAIGEIGLDLFVPALTTPAAVDRQTWFFDEQLKVARDFDLPVLLHVRRAQDQVLAGLRRVRRRRPAPTHAVGPAWAATSAWPATVAERATTSRPAATVRAPTAAGIAHAFNGSRQQADQFLALGFKLGFGGASTHERALRIRALARDLPDDAIVLETDAPDIAPAWLHAATGGSVRNAPGELRRIAEDIAALRGTTLHRLAEATTRNAHAALPRLAHALAVAG